MNAKERLQAVHWLMLQKDLKKLEMRVALYLVFNASFNKDTPLTGKGMGDALSLSQPHVAEVLITLQKRGIVIVTREHTRSINKIRLVRDTLLLKEFKHGADNSGSRTPVQEA